MKIVTVIGARPQFIKAAPVSKALRAAGHQDFILHTGQHYDYGMSQVFFDELNIPEPEVNLGVGSGGHGQQTGQMLTGIEEILARLVDNSMNDRRPGDRGQGTEDRLRPPSRVDTV